MKRFVGRRAIVTGGASGLGLGIVQRLLSEGARVIVWDADPLVDDKAKSAGAEGGLVLDVTDWPAVEAAAQRSAETLGAVDILVASAGITGPNGPAWTYPIDQWKRVMDINVNGLYYCNRAVVPLMLSAGYGRIVNIASVAGKEGNPNASAYSTSKAAVIGLTKSLGKELAETDIRVNCVTPAAVDTPLFAQMSEAQIAYMLSKIPMKRFGMVPEVAALVAWLSSEECSFSTGAVFDISGGRATY
ncbi:SDR family oxidoreductase [Acidisoma cellulosilytica]|uniref:SDR family oxidoreductase n=1 Tax=Acidisoma cellulosilyticum TaxID=2802395 RepID=A0A963Z1U9_9PROT|nr:SDR family NAD(P)-dependent oxidoreductase [Acidisoma cellulosilyticum]MCB8881076.1 SDR family oxidoreductase [Acidisoma cellulosilyticum]